MSGHIPWFEKYRPISIQDFTQNVDLTNLFRNSIHSTQISHYLFYGPPGTGKTSAILAIAHEIFGEYFRERCIEFNASDDRGIGAVREKITSEAKKYVEPVPKANGEMVPGYKIIILDEADSMTDEAQDALRVIIEQYSAVTRFCFICNYIFRITDAIKSRCSVIYFKQMNRECMMQRLQYIAECEQVDITPDNMETIIHVANGDLRRAIMLLQNLNMKIKIRKFKSKPHSEMNLHELSIMTLDGNREKIQGITTRDVYHAAAQIDDTQAEEIIQSVIKCQDIVMLSDQAREIIAMSYPIDNVLQQIHKNILESALFSDHEKALIIKYTGKIFMRIKECANEYMQILDYLICVNAVHQKWPHPVQCFNPFKSNN